MTEDQFLGQETNGFMLVEYEAPGNYRGLTKTVLSTSYSVCTSAAVAVSADGTPDFGPEPVETCTEEKGQEEVVITEIVVADQKGFARTCHPDETQCGEWQSGDMPSPKSDVAGFLIGGDPHATPDWPLFMLSKLSDVSVVGQDTIEGQLAVHLRGKFSLWRMFFENAQRHLEGTGTPFGTSCRGDVCTERTFEDALQSDEAVLESDANPVYADVWVSTEGTLPLRIHVSPVPTRIDDSGALFRVNYGSYNQVNVEAPDVG
jgi:hypothetical protein